MKMFFLNAALAVILFFLNAFLGRIQYGFSGKLFAYGKFRFAEDEGESFAGNFFLRIVNPTIFMAISCSVSQQLFSEDICRGLWLLVPIFWIIRIVYIFAKNRASIINWKYEIFAAALSLILAEMIFWGMIIPLVDAHERIFISITELRDAVWYAIIAYIATIVWSVGKTRFNGDALYPAEKRKKIILDRYTLFSEKYGNQILDRIGNECFENKDEKGKFICLVYAVMTYEDYNRPRLYRFGERILKRLGLRREMTLGIMQVKTD